MASIPQTKLLVLGFDAMDVELVRGWAAAGYLPTFRHLFESSAWTDYVDPPELVSGTIWTGIATGLRPLRHDYSFFMRFCGDSYRMRLARADEIQGDWFWKWFAQSGRRVVLADVPHSVPKPEYGGKQIFGWGVHDWPWKRSSVPKPLLSRLTSRFGAHPVPYCHNYSTKTDSLMRLRSGLLAGIERRTAILKSLILDRDWDLFYAVYSEPHCAGHLMWHIEDETHPGHRPEQLATVGHGLRDVYAAIDKGLGELIACADVDTTCAVLFPHGMGPNYHGEHLFPKLVARFNRWWKGESPGADRRDDSKGWVGSAWQASVGRLPATWRDSVRQRLPISLRSWITAKRRQNPMRWSQMPAFSLPEDGFSSLRVNLVGREPQGRIRPGEEYRRYLDAFMEQLSQLTNAESGEPVVERVFRADQRVDPVSIGAASDLIIWWSKESPIRVIRSAALGTIADEFTDIRTGEHVMRGMLLVSHPRAKPGRQIIAGMNALDICSTLCGLAGVPPGSAVDGTNRCRNFLAE